MARELVLLSISPPSTTGPGAGDAAAGSTPSPRPNLPANGSNFQNFADQSAELARILTGATGAAIAFREDEATICRARSGEGAPRLGASVDITSGISKQCLDSGEALCCENIATDNRVDSEAARALGIRSLAVAPIYTDGKVAGILEVFSNTPGIFTEQHLKTLRHLALMVGSAATIPSEARPANKEPAGQATVDAPRNGQPKLSLLIDREAAYRTFFRNFAYMFSRSPETRFAGSSILAPGWNYVVIDYRVPWKRFFQSVSLHLATVALIAGLAQIWPRELTVDTQAHRNEHIIYYPFAGASPVAQENRATPRTPRQQRAAAHHATSNTASAPEVASNSSPENDAQPSATPAAPPTTEGLAGRKPKLAANSVVPPAPDMVVTGSSRRPHLPIATVIGPPPELAAGSGGRRLNGPVAEVIPPSPNAQGAMRRPGFTSTGQEANNIVPPPPAMDGHAGLTYAGTSGGSKLAIQIVGPPPSLQAHGKLGGRGSAVSFGNGASDVVPPPPVLEGAGSAGKGGPQWSSANGSQIVPPPPSVQGDGTYGGRGRVTALSGSGSGSQIVPPPPSMRGAGGRGNGGGIAAMSGNGSIVPPPPSVQGNGNGGGGRFASLGGNGSGIVPPPPSIGGGGGGRGRIGALGAGSIEVVPPPPSMGGSGYGGGGRVASLAGSGSGVVPPPPSLQGEGDGGTGRIGSLGGNGSGVVPPPPSMEGRGGGSGRGNSGGFTSMASGVVPPPPSADGVGTGSAGGPRSMARPGGEAVSPPDIPKTSTQPAPSLPQNQAQPSFQDVQLRVMVAAWAPPRSSYFSNYEVFIAQKWLNKETPQLIKLVYVFLPYQRRLSEYGADSWKVRKLRVTRDPSCDESLMQIEWPEGENPPAGSKAAGVANKPTDKDSPLPCYRTTADDYRKAIASR